MVCQIWTNALLVLPVGASIAFSAKTASELDTMRWQSGCHNSALTHGIREYARLPLAGHCFLPLLDCLMAKGRQLFRYSEGTQRPHVVMPGELLFKRLHTIEVSQAWLVESYAVNVSMPGRQAPISERTIVMQHSLDNTCVSA